MKKKIIISFCLLLLVVGLAGTFWGTSIAEAASGVWNSCPRGKVNDTYPGDCSDYIDTNNDAICDRSQSNPDSDIASAISTEPEVTDGTGTGPNSAGAPGNNHSYYFIPVSAVVVVWYSLTWMLSARKVISNMLHRKIWNVVLLISFTVSALLGIVRILSIDSNIDISLPFSALFWHVEWGIVLSVVALFHILWHWRYFAKMLGRATVRNS
ncbi:MAG: hypothetical protein PHN78_07805 [Dehalococcoidales bacterium]|nr:hypothetical protein [Dehalococcoidales bacterium]